MLKIYTVQIAVAGKLGLTKDHRYLDITVRSGDRIFAPTWKMVMGVKQSRMSEEEYTHEYSEMMRVSYQDNSQRWDEILNMEEVILSCYCRADLFCHRYLLKDMMVKFGGEYVGDIRVWSFTNFRSISKGD